MIFWIAIDIFDKGIKQARLTCLTEFVLLRYSKIHIGIDVIWWGRALFSKYIEWTLKSELIGWWLPCIEHKVIYTWFDTQIWIGSILQKTPTVKMRLSRNRGMHMHFTHLNDLLYYKREIEIAFWLFIINYFNSSHQRMVMNNRTSSIEVYFAILVLFW